MQQSEIIALAWAALFVIAVRIMCAEESSPLATAAFCFTSASVLVVFVISLFASL